jgi:hypothetical protein
MLKRLAIVFVANLLLIGAIVFVAHKYQPASEQPELNTQEKAQPSQPSPSQNQATQNRTQQRSDSSPWWHILVAWPAGIGAWAVIATLEAIIWQTIETRRAAEGALENAKATRRQADIAKEALVSQFRPKVILRSAVLNPRNFKAYRAANDGIWQIELLLVNTGSTEATIETCELEFEWTKNDPLPWDDKPTGIFTKTWPSFVIAAAGRHRLEASIPYDSGFSITFDVIVQGMSNPFASGQHGAWPTCHGKIVYVDNNGHRRQTGFYRKWNILRERFEASDDPEQEYSD